MKIYSLNCRKHIDNIGKKKVIMTSTVTREASKGANCVAKKARFLKLDFNKKSGWDKINPKFFIH